eukprot:CAMPEP_0176414428 /NCGR_PEP_ID=MMETSP0127-20121128/5252_1 /TAXON_ID=938130 /ORGANISM="Platyophrya macrostoma, Strain WH" /LENGTH=214 /DNA_ID=CAMNT_0017794325 /DNA_START=54 /DNA_END=698 /DNA_ORIENTATION=-
MKLSSGILFFCAVSLVATAVSAASSFDGCNVTTADNTTVNVAYLESYGNVSISTTSGASSVALVSLCTPMNITANDLSNCGPAYLAVVGSTCSDSLLFDTVSSDLTVVNIKSTRIDFTSSHNATLRAIVNLVCQAGLDAVLSASNVTVLDGATYTFEFTSEFVCAGYAPAASSDDSSNMLSKGAIVGIIIGVVIAAALFQWRAKSNSASEYQRI